MVRDLQESLKQVGYTDLALIGFCLGEVVPSFPFSFRKHPATQGLQRE